VNPLFLLILLSAINHLTFVGVIIGSYAVRHQWRRRKA